MEKNKNENIEIVEPNELFIEITKMILDQNKMILQMNKELLEKITIVPLVVIKGLGDILKWLF